MSASSRTDHLLLRRQVESNDPGAEREESAPCGPVVVTTTSGGDRRPSQRLARLHTNAVWSPNNLVRPAFAAGRTNGSLPLHHKSFAEHGYVASSHHLAPFGAASAARLNVALALR